MTLAARGATCADNNKESILAATREMLNAVFEKNGIYVPNVISIVFSCTEDLTAVYPAVAAREMGLADAALFCVREMRVEGSLPRCIRVLVTFEARSGKSAQAMVRHVYLREAAALRPDLSGTGGFRVAIDGPGGSGKSTAAKSAAKKLGFTYIDSGAMYRAVALFAAENGENLKERRRVEKLLPQINMTYKEGRLLLNGRDVSEKLRSKAAGEGASIVATYPNVRKRLVALQREISRGLDVVMDGRDVGTNVFPDAEVKIYMDADIDARAKRRALELAQLDQPCDPEVIKKEIIERDQRDKTRKLSPLRKAKDAEVIDTSAMTADEVAARVVEIINRRKS